MAALLNNPRKSSIGGRGKRGPQPEDQRQRVLVRVNWRLKISIPTTFGVYLFVSEIIFSPNAYETDLHRALVIFCLYLSRVQTFPDDCLC